MDKDFLDNHPALQVIREDVDDSNDEENEQVQVSQTLGLSKKKFEFFFYVRELRCINSPLSL